MWFFTLYWRLRSNLSLLCDHMHIFCLIWIPRKCFFFPFLFSDLLLKLPIPCSRFLLTLYKQLFRHCCDTVHAYWNENDKKTKIMKAQEKISAVMRQHMVHLAPQVKRWDFRFQKCFEAEIMFSAHSDDCNSFYYFSLQQWNCAGRYSSNFHVGNNVVGGNPPPTSTCWQQVKTQQDTETELIFSALFPPAPKPRNA